MSSYMYFYDVHVCIYRPILFIPSSYNWMHFVTLKLYTTINIDKIALFLDPSKSKQSLHIDILLGRHSFVYTLFFSINWITTSVSIYLYGGQVSTGPRTVHFVSYPHHMVPNDQANNASSNNLKPISTTNSVISLSSCRIAPTMHKVSFVAMTDAVSRTC
jgi:hypothetical protein